MNDSAIQIRGTVLGNVNKRVDKNGSDYFYGKLSCDDGTQQAFFFFRPNDELSMRLKDLKGGSEVSLMGGWGKRKPVIFVATGFYLEEESLQSWPNS